MGAGAIPLHVEKEFFEKAKGKYKINVYLADVTYDGDDRIDVSAQGGYFVFAPPRHLLFDYRFGNITKSQFKEAYFKLLWESYINHRDTWDGILTRKRVVLVCTCNSKGKDCHRYFVVDFLKELGGVYKGKLKS
jgi:hypothetical protein